MGLDGVDKPTREFVTVQVLSRVNETGCNLECHLNRTMSARRTLEYLDSVGQER